MREVAYLEDAAQVEAVLSPQRLKVLRELAVPRTCSELATRLDQSPQRVYYHVKRLERAGVVELTSERRVNGIQEGTYRAVAKKFWLSPHIVGEPAENQARAEDENLARLLDLAERIQRDIAFLDQTAPGRPSVGISGQIRVRPEDREGFLAELSQSIQHVFTRYGGSEGESFALAVACYPANDTKENRD